MQKNLATVLVLASLVIGAFALSAVADVRGGGQSLAQRVTALEASAERQRRAIDSLREENRRQDRALQRLLRFRTAANERIAVLERRTSKLSGRGVYSGPVDNGQVRLGADPADCAGAVAEWNAAGTSLGCVPPPPA